MEGALKLLKTGANIHAPNDDGFFPLHIAALNGRLGLVRLLVSYGASVTARGTAGLTALDLAAQANHAPVVKFLLDHGAIPDHQVWCCQYAVHTAASRGYIDIVRIFIQKGAPRSILGYMLRGAINENRLDVVELLVQTGASLKAEDKTILGLASYYRFNSSGGTPLHLAASLGYLEIVKYLVDSGAEINARNHNDFTPMISALNKGKRGVAFYLKSIGGDPTRMALHEGVEKLYNHETGQYC